MGLGDEHQPFLWRGEPDRNPQPQCASLHQAIHGHCSGGWNGRADYHVPSTYQRDSWTLHWPSNIHQWLDNSYRSLDTHCRPSTTRVPHMLSQCLVTNDDPLSRNSVILSRDRDRLSENQQEPQVHPVSRERRSCLEPRLHRSHSHTCHGSHIIMARLARTYLYSILEIRVSIHLARNPRLRERLARTQLVCLRIRHDILHCRGLHGGFFVPCKVAWQGNQSSDYVSDRGRICSCSNGLVWLDRLGDGSPWSGHITPLTQCNAEHSHRRLRHLSSSAETLLRYAEHSTELLQIHGHNIDSSFGNLLE